MARWRRDESGIPETCPTLDAILDALSKCECDAVPYHTCKSDIETIRKENARLRDWGNEQYQRAEDAEEKVRTLEWELEYRTGD